MKDIEEVVLFDDKYNGSILNLIPFYYDKAKKYYNELESIKKSIDEFVFEDKEVVIKKSFSKKKKYKELTFD